MRPHNTVIYLHLVGQRSTLMLRTCKVAGIAVSAIATACCGRESIPINNSAGNKAEFIDISTGIEQDEVFFMHVSSFPGEPNKVSKPDKLAHYYPYTPAELSFNISLSKQVDLVSMYM